MRVRVEEARTPVSREGSRWHRMVLTIRDWVLPADEGRFRAGLKAGLASGMMLGSLALVGFHQLAAPAGAGVSTAEVPRTSTGRVVLTQETPIAYPGLSIEVAIPRGGDRAAGPWLALTPTGILRLVSGRDLSPRRYAVQAIRLRAGEVMAPGVVPRAAVNQEENALALTESALLAAVSWAADGGRQIDAQQALKNALSAYPSAPSAWPTDEAPSALDLRQSLEGMLLAVNAARRAAVRCWRCRR